MITELYVTPQFDGPPAAIQADRLGVHGGGKLTLMWDPASAGLCAA
jgi:hypothetical protein